MEVLVLQQLIPLLRDADLIYAIKWIENQRIDIGDDKVSILNKESRYLLIKQIF